MANQGIDLLILFSNFYELTEDIVKLSRLFRPTVKNARRKHYYEKYHKGMRLKVQLRKKVFDILCDYYRDSTESISDFHTVRTMGAQGETDLALVTNPDYLLSQNTKFNINSTYSGEKKINLESLGLGG